ncbi:SMI1/KNR4 family protein [Flavobacterium sp. 140616W15]|uniref:SMI1/KNR4 family protein n=1 Tax=Flavobacterium sp. 140616W15 TaxID=2478552 RepID=UPI000F0C2980|nr:SMI1/KNR4 family protein [Flavobacterium sp. 140616W15]AYN04391.1 SMI1/KNR4 family protein [Flavobacterium sp. 140616W15]
MDKQDYNLENIADGKLKNIDISYILFLKKINKLTNKEETVWFNSLIDYSNLGTDKSAFLWNDFEVDSLECAEDDEERNEIVKFWKKYLPFLISVKNGYSYLGIGIKGANIGKIVYGREPEYEEIEVIANSFEEFMELHSSETAQIKDFI